MVSELEGLHLKYNTSVTFNTLKTTDSGSYTCSATVGPQERNNHLISSSRTADTISISVGMLVYKCLYQWGMWWNMMMLLFFSPESNH